MRPAPRRVRLLVVMLSVVFALITVGLSVMLYAYLTWSDPDVNWVRH